MSRPLKLLKAKSSLKIIFTYSVLFIAISFASISTAEETTNNSNVDQVVNEGEIRVKEGTKAQSQVEKINDKTRDYVAEYQQTLKVIEGLEVYNGLIQKQVDHQNSELQDIQNSLDEVTLIERQVVPLMVRMIDSLEQFIALDVPFQLEERTTRVERLRETIQRSDVTTAEKFRNVLNAYQIEVDFGSDSETYEGEVKIGEGVRQVNFLRIGRVALLYQTPDGEYSGAWNQEKGEWESLTSSTFKQQIKKGIRIARKQIAPELMILPVLAAEETES